MGREEKQAAQMVSYENQSRSLKQRNLSWGEVAYLFIKLKTGNVLLEVTS